ncbi:hypothetical protein LG293_16090 (plasmid) [Citricoccus nitrophenolicus]
MSENTTPPTADRPKADWFTDTDRDMLLGFGLRNGNTRTHITRQTVGGPGAVLKAALCHGVQSVVWMDSSLDLSDEDACRRFLSAGVRIPLGAKLEDHVPDSMLPRLCPRCTDRYDRIFAHDNRARA